jgi:hypothetical protein
VALALSRRPAAPAAPRITATAEILERRGYALPPARLAAICLGGAVAEREVWDVLTVRDGLAVRPGSPLATAAVAARAATHDGASISYVPAALAFTRRLLAAAPFIVSVSIAGSLASGGFTASDDIDLNLVVEDGHRHLAYVVLNVLGIADALRHRGKPVDDLSRRPLAPRVMTANLILERSDWSPLRRQDEQMAFELLVQEPVFGAEFLRSAIAANPRLLTHFPQLADREPRWTVEAPRRAPTWLYHRRLDRVAHVVGSAAWRYMMWTRRHRPEALRRVELVRRSMRPYALFDAS